MTTNKTKLTAIVLAQLARESIETDADRIEALYLAINYIEFGTDLAVLENLDYPKHEQSDEDLSRVMIAEAQKLPLLDNQMIRELKNSCSIENWNKATVLEVSYVLMTCNTEAFMKAKEELNSSIRKKQVTVQDIIYTIELKGMQPYLNIKYDEKIVLTVPWYL